MKRRIVFYIQIVQLPSITFLPTSEHHGYDAVKEARWGTMPFLFALRGYRSQVKSTRHRQVFSRILSMHGGCSSLIFPHLCLSEASTPFSDMFDGRWTCSEIIPFKLDLDNSSERTSCFLIPHPAPVWRTDWCRFPKDKSACLLKRLLS